MKPLNLTVFFWLSLCLPQTCTSSNYMNFLEQLVGCLPDDYLFKVPPGNFTDRITKLNATLYCLMKREEKREKGVIICSQQNVSKIISKLFIKQPYGNTAVENVFSCDVKNTAGDKINVTDFTAMYGIAVQRKTTTNKPAVKNETTTNKAAVQNETTTNKAAGGPYSVASGCNQCNTQHTIIWILTLCLIVALCSVCYIYYQNIQLKKEKQLTELHRILLQGKQASESYKQ